MSARTAGNILLTLMFLLMGFHILVLIGIIPDEMVWGGQTVGNTVNKGTLELVALFSTILFSIIISMKLEYLWVGKFTKAINIVMWVIFAFFLLNIIGNFASTSAVEKFLFGPLTIIMSMLALRVAIEKKGS